MCDLLPPLTSSLYQSAGFSVSKKSVLWSYWRGVFWAQWKQHTLQLDERAPLLINIGFFFNWCSGVLVFSHTPISSRTPFIPISVKKYAISCGNSLPSPPFFFLPSYYSSLSSDNRGNMARFTGFILCADALVHWYDLLSSVYTSSLAATAQLDDDCWQRKRNA